MTRFLRFVKSAHFFAIAFACIFGVFVTTNAVAVQACSSGQYYHVINGRCQTCPSTSGWTTVDCSTGYWKCNDYQGLPSVPRLNDPQTDDYFCVVFNNSPFTGNAFTNCNGRSYTSCRTYKIQSGRTGCKYSTYDNSVKINYKIKATSTGSEDPETRTKFNPYELGTESGWQVVGYDYEAKPGYAKNTSNGTCTQCTGYTASGGGSVTSCTPCLYGQGDISGYDEEVFEPRIMDGLTATNGGVLALGGTRGSASSDGTKCEINGAPGSDGTGSYVSGTCTMTPVPGPACFTFVAAAYRGSCTYSEQCLWLTTACAAEAPYTSFQDCVGGLQWMNYYSDANMYYDGVQGGYYSYNDMGFNGGGAMVYLEVCFNTEYALQDFLGTAGIVAETLAGVYHYYD